MPKIDGFYSLYNRKLSPYIGDDLKFLEIGVQDGSSIKRWREMSPRWQVYGLDVDPRCAGEGITIGSQEDKEILKQFEGFDIVIDDGGHTWKQQIETFEQLFPTMRQGALYVIEDLHTSFWQSFGDYHVSTVEYLKSLVDDIHHTHANDVGRTGGQVLSTSNIYAIEFYPSIVFIYKK